jgi:hypothetical protein
MAKKRVKQTKSNSTTHHDHAPTGLYLVTIAAIIAMVAMVTLFTDTDTTSMSLSEEDLAGQAIQPVTEPCAESDGGNDPYTKGYSTGTYPWGYAVLGGVPDKCRLNNNQPTASCTNCKLMEYYCVDDPNDPRYGHLFWEFYTGVDCVNGAAAQPQQSCSIAAATINELDDYPRIFNGTNSTFNGTFVLGAGAPASDLIALMDISQGLEDDGITVDQSQFLLDSGVSNVCDQNIVVVGDVCENTVLQEILGYGAGDCADAYADLYLDSNEAYIGLFESDDGEIYLIVTGEDSEVRRAAAIEVVEHNFNSQQYVIYQHDICAYQYYGLDPIRDNLDDFIDELEEEIDDLDDETTQFTADLEAVLSTFNGVYTDVSSALSYIWQGNYEDAVDELEDAIDDMENELDDFEDIIFDIEDEGYDEEPFDDLHENFEDVMLGLDDIREVLALNCP